MKKILIIRNDKLGDFMLAYPSFAIAKKYLNDTEIHTLVPHYTKKMAESCEWIDKVIIDPGSNSGWLKNLLLLQQLKKEKYDAVITLFSTTRIGLITKLSGIPYRIAPATKFAQLFYNYKLSQRRSESLKPEYEYNLDLVKKYLSDTGITVKNIPKAPFLHINDVEINNLRTNFCKKNQLEINSKLYFIHPGTGGSATNINIEQYADLAKHINIGSKGVIVITAGPEDEELEYANKLSLLIKYIPHIIYHSTSGLYDFTKIIQLCDIFISGSTGPLHIAGALDRPTAAFYQRRRSATALRWQTLNSKERRLAFTPPENEGESDMQKINIVEAAKAINQKFLKN
ncbi:MAG: glycosyltransferase family 9 protein [Woeseiaceae bacterium]